MPSLARYWTIFQVSTGETFKGYWDIRLQDVQVGGASLPSSEFCLIDSGSTSIVAPVEAVGMMARINGAECFNIEDGEPTPVDCMGGFDMAEVDCDKPSFSLDFIADYLYRHETIRSPQLCYQRWYLVQREHELTGTLGIVVSRVIEMFVFAI